MARDEQRRETRPAATARASRRENVASMRRKKAKAMAEKINGRPAQGVAQTCQPMACAGVQRISARRMGERDMASDITGIAER